MLTRAQHADLKRDFVADDGPPADDRPLPTEWPESADGEPIVEDLAYAADGPVTERGSRDAEAAGAGTSPREILPLETFDASQWEGVAIEPRRWIAFNRIPQGEPGIMSGDGGTGKTKLALQLAAAIAAGLRDWVGGVVDAEGPVIVRPRRS